MGKVQQNKMRRWHCIVTERQLPIHLEKVEKESEKKGFIISSKKTKYMVVSKSYCPRYGLQISDVKTSTEF